jgi:DNA-binding beta-propeller fold protein YncE
VAHPQIAAFARLANGGREPDRRIYGQNSRLSRTMHDIRYNALNDEIVVPNPFANAILTFRGGADGQEAPIRVIQGPNTQLNGPDRLDIDIVNREIFVPGRLRGGEAGGGVLVFPLDGNGDVPPKRVLRGPDTEIEGGSIAVDPINNLMAVTGRDRSLLIFERTASGNTKPLRVIRGPNTQIDRINQMTIYPSGRLLVVAMPGVQGAMEPPRVFVGMWSLDDDGDVAPKWTITGKQTGLKKPFAVALNPDHKEIYVTDMRLNGVMTFHLPEVFQPAARGVSENPR